MPSTPVSIYVGNTPPAAQVGGAYPLWLSTHPADVRPPPGPAAKIALLTPTLTHEGTLCQEVNAWWHGGKWHCYYSCGNGVIGYASGASPRDWQANKHPTAVLGQGAGGEASYIAHGTIYIEGDFVYFTYALGPTGYRMARAALADPTALTYQQVLLAYPGTIAAPNIGNSRIVKDGGTYHLFFEGSGGAGLATGVGSWQEGVATASSLLGPYTVEQYPLPTLWPYGRKAGGRMQFQRAGDRWIARAHCMTTIGGLPSELFVYETKDLRNFRLLDNGYPVQSPVGESGDQCADWSMEYSGEGIPWVFWSQLVNATSGGASGRVMGAPGICPVKAFDGARWETVQHWQSEAPSPRFRLRPLEATTTTLSHWDDAYAECEVNYTTTLPPAIVGGQVRVTHYGTANTLTVNANDNGAAADDVVRPANAPLTAGQTAHYRCQKPGIWVRS